MPIYIAHQCQNSHKALITLVLPNRNCTLMEINAKSYI